MEVEIVTFVVKRSAQPTVPPDLQEYMYIQEGSRSEALLHVFDFKLSRIHLTKIILKIWVIDGQYFIDICVCDVTFSFELRAKTVGIPLRMSTEICRL